MPQGKRSCFAVAVCTAILCFTLAGCTGQTAANSENDSVAANRQYMSTVNQTVDELSDRLDSFVDAVSRNDSVTMRTQADSAFQILDKLSNIEAPEDLTELKDGYVQACDSLKGALNSYITLYTDIESSSESQPFDYASYGERIQEVQSQYDEGIQKLEDTDKLATELQK